MLGRFFTNPVCLVTKELVIGACSKSLKGSQIRNQEITFNCLYDKTLAKGNLYKPHIYSKLNIYAGGSLALPLKEKNVLQIKFESEPIEPALIRNIRSLILQYITRIEVYFGVLQMVDLYPRADIQILQGKGIGV